MESKKVVIEITINGESSYVVDVAKGTEFEDSFVEDGKAGVAGRVASIVDNLQDYFEPDAPAEGEGSTTA